MASKKKNTGSVKDVIKLAQQISQEAKLLQQKNEHWYEESKAKLQASIKQFAKSDKRITLSQKDVLELKSLAEKGAEQLNANTKRMSKYRAQILKGNNNS